MIALLLLIVLCTLVLYLVVRKGVAHGIIDADIERERHARQVREAGQRLPDAPTS